MFVSAGTVDGDDSDPARSVDADSVRRKLGAAFGSGPRWVNVLVAPATTNRRRRLADESVLFSAGVELNGFAAQTSGDVDGDGVPNEGDSCPLDPENDLDGDGLCGAQDCFDDVLAVTPDGDYCSAFRRGAIRGASDTSE